jgi:hypothetical protein
MRHTLTRRRPRRIPPIHDPSLDWRRHETYQINGRVLVPGTEFSVHGEPGRFRFLYVIQTPAGATWVDGIGGRVKEPQWRSFRLNQIKTIHRIPKTRQSLEET